MTWLDYETNWAVLTRNPQGQTLRQAATSFEHAWRLAQPPAVKGWSVVPKEDVYELFLRNGASYVYVAYHTDGTDRIIHRPV